jgi:hypothetical protein
LPNLVDEQYYDEGVKMIMKHFPVHLLKCPNNDILAVFNNGALYKKPTMNTGIWSGPLPHSMPMLSPLSSQQHGEIPLRMITIAPNMRDYLGVAYDNNLYIKTSVSASKQLDISVPWKLVPNSSNIIYVITDQISKKLIGVSIAGDLMIKETAALDSTFIKLPSPGVAVLKVYYDVNHHMLLLDDKFNLWQLLHTDIQQSTQINSKRGANTTRVNDIMYDSDGKLFGVVFPLGGDKLQLMKQNNPYYLSGFLPFFALGTSSSSSDMINYMMSASSIILSKTGVDFTKSEEDKRNEFDDDVQYAVQMQHSADTKKLRKLCSAKQSEFDPRKMENYDLLDTIDDNATKITKLEAVLQKLRRY